eukprot:TRINITY_DN16306_c0_g1_i6.p1 TRINITY_DN16306_c0_g1~~TRINITY_DN16306_c0_g1_i6.p1  ORF type:complete len:114 (+),score=19.40 TRINITY_DN16306_c0_g1_i6:140-481(+)
MCIRDSLGIVPDAAAHRPLQVDVVFAVQVGEDPILILQITVVPITLPESVSPGAVSYTHLRAHETPEHLVCRLLLEKKKKKKHYQHILKSKNILMSKQIDHSPNSKSHNQPLL